MHQHSPKPNPLPLPFSLLTAIAILPTACFDPLFVEDTGSGSEEGTTAAADESTTAAETTSVEPDSGSGDPLPVCGDAVVEGDEVCDDGVNDGGYGGCNADCTAPGPFCGDGVVNGEEPCDDGDAEDGNGCNVDCVVSGSVLWTVTYDGPDHGIDAASSVTTDSASNIIVSGTLSAGAEAAGWLRKYSPEGAEVWTFDVTAPTGPVHNGPVTTLLDDDIVFGGSYGPSAPSRDAWLWRISVVGEPVWTQTYTSAQGGWDRVLAIDIDDNGYAYALFEETQLPSEPYYRTFVRKYTPAGDEVWTQFHDSAIRGRLLSNDGQGRFVVAGTQRNGGVDDVWVQQNTSDGAEIWAELVEEGGSATYPSALSVNSEGAIALVTSPSDSAPRVIRLSPDGQEDNVSFPHPDAPVLVIFAAHLEDDDSLILGGSTIVSDDDAYGWVSKYNAEGSELWSNTHDGSFDNAFSFDAVLAVTTDPAGNIIAAGEIHDSANLLSNIWVSKYAP
jgi:cysteine-rich repeat protein